MPQLFSKDRRILEREYLQSLPFGVDTEGKKIRDVGGLVVRANVEYLEELMVQEKNAHAGVEAVDQLVKCLNNRIRNAAYHVSSSILKNPWNSYSYEFVMFLAEFCQDISGRTDFQLEMAKKKLLSPIIQVLGRPFSLETIFQRYPQFVDKYTRGALQAKTIQVSSGKATLQLRLTDDTAMQFGPYRNRCAHLICQSGKTALTMIPPQMGGSKPATVKENCCMSDGSEYCEWDIQWLPPVPAKILWPIACFGSWVAVFAHLQIVFSALALWESLIISIFPPLFLWTAHLWWDLKKEIKQKDKILDEELRFVDSGQEELRDVHVDQTQSLVQHDMLKQLFSAHVSNEVAEAIWDQRDQFFHGNQPRSQKLTATVMFTDLEGFTAIAESMEPDALYEWINMYMETLIQTVMAHGGEVDDYFGDGIKVDFGVPIPRTTEQEICEDANRAVQSAITINHEMQELNALLMNQGLPPMRLRIGIATGPVVAGILGNAKRRKYTTLGDTVNIAARLEAYSKQFGDLFPEMSHCKILISQITNQYLSPQIPTEKLGPIRVKGKKDQILPTAS